MSKEIFIALILLLIFICISFIFGSLEEIRSKIPVIPRLLEPQAYKPDGELIKLYPNNGIIIIYLDSNQVEFFVKQKGIK